MNGEPDARTGDPRQDGVTLQVNVSAGDIAYCGLTVPALVAAHRGQVDEVVVVADTCRPSSTPFLHAPSRFPPAEFEERVATLLGLCNVWAAQGLVDRVVVTQQGSPALADLNRRYSDTSIEWSHDHLGHAFSSYFCGWDSARTRYVVHTDADILLYQQPGFQWARHALEYLRADPALVAASPRICPPDPHADFVRTEAPGSGWLPSWRLDRSEEGWRSDWISTRLHLVDRQRLAALLPLRGRSIARHLWARAVNAAAGPMYRSAQWHNPPDKNLWGRWPSRLAHRAIPAYPLPPEVMLHHALERTGARCLYLSDTRSWYVHPDTKPHAFSKALPRLLRSIGSGDVPPGQLGVSGLQYGAWLESPA